MMASTHEWIKNPKPEFAYSEKGLITAMYLKIRTGKASRTVWPNKDYLVFLLVGNDNLPIGIKFLEPTIGVAVSEVTTKLLESADGRPEGVVQETKHYFITRQEVDQVLRKITKAVMSGTKKFEKGLTVQTR